MNITKKYELENGPIHDILVEANLIEFECDYSDEFYEGIFNLLPEHDRDTALEWGTSDTPFKDNAYVYVMDNKEIFRKFINGHVA